MITVKNVGLYHGKKTIQKDLSCSIDLGEIKAITGRNGSGKTTLLKSILGLHSNFQGEITVKGSSITDFSAHRISQTFAVVLTRLSVPGMMSVKELMMVVDPIAVAKNKEDHLKEVANKLAITDLLDRYLDTLSDGQLQRVMIARALYQNSPYLIMDEPFSHLDHEAKWEIKKVLQLEAEAGKAVLFTTHDLLYIEDIEQCQLPS